MKSEPKSPEKPANSSPAVAQIQPRPPEEKLREIGGRKGLEPTRYGDWENCGKCVDF